MQLKHRTKTERSKTILQGARKLLLQERIYINHIIRGRLKNSIEHLKGLILESTAPVEFCHVKTIHQNVYKKSFDLTKERYIRKFLELISKNKAKKANNINR